MAIEESERPPGSRLPAIQGGEVVAVGVNPTLLLSSDVPIAVGQDGALYYPELGPDRRLRIMRFTRSGDRSVRALLPGVLRWVNGLAAGADGSLYYTEDKAVRRIDPRGLVSTLAESVAVPNCIGIPGTEPGSEAQSQKNSDSNPKLDSSPKSKLTSTKETRSVSLVLPDSSSTGFF